MKNTKLSTGTSLLALLTLLASGARAQEVSPTCNTAKAYGEASGDMPLRGYGLILELVGVGTDTPRLRLFGGVPGNLATINVSSTQIAEGGWDGTLVGDGVAVTGTFDWHGYFEVPIAALPRGYYYAQGTHVGHFASERSNGLELQLLVETEERLTLDDLKPHLPPKEPSAIKEASGLGNKLSAALDTAEAIKAMGLTGNLRAMLNSVGDSVALNMHIEASGGTGVNIGATRDLEVEIVRTSEGVYELRTGTDLGITAGAELSANVEAQAEGAFGKRHVYRFHSADGAARGVRGLVLALAFPGRSEVEDGSRSAAEMAGAFRVRVQAAQADLQAAEAFLKATAERRLNEARSRRDAARAARDRAQRAYSNARRKTAALVRDLLARRAAYAVAEASYRTAQTANDAALKAADWARVKLEDLRAPFEEALARAARLGRIALAIGQSRGFATDHYVGLELRQTRTASVEAKVKIPGIDIDKVGIGVEGSVEMGLSILFEEPTTDAPKRVTVTRRYQTNSSLGLKKKKEHAIEGEEDPLEIIRSSGFLETERSLEMVDTFELGEDDRWHRVNRSRALGKDTQIGKVGRSLEIGVSNEENVLALFKNEGLAAAIEGLGSKTGSLSIQDRREKSFGFDLEISYAGNGGGVACSLEWADQGRLLEKELSLAEAVERVTSMIEEVVDEDSGMVLKVQP